MRLRFDCRKSAPPLCAPRARINYAGLASPLWKRRCGAALGAPDGRCDNVPAVDRRAVPDWLGAGGWLATVSVSPRRLVWRAVLAGGSVGPFLRVVATNRFAGAVAAFGCLCDGDSAGACVAWRGAAAAKAAAAPACNECAGAAAGAWQLANDHACA